MRAPKEPTCEELLADSHGIPDSDSPRPGLLSSSQPRSIAPRRKALPRASSLGLGLEDDEDDLDPFQALEKKGYHWDTFDKAADAYATDEHEYGSRAAWASSTPQLSDFWWTAWVSQESTGATAVATTVWESPAAATVLAIDLTLLREWAWQAWQAPDQQIEKSSLKAI
ncbi:hypothetical protein K3495_g7141 [Podosphaera aphanis]|nr:hypothetical protein K3495_g7141 [Podosphaera aphanis]